LRRVSDSSTRARGFALVALTYVVAGGAALFAAETAPFSLALTLGWASLVMTLVCFAASFVAKNSSYFDPYWMAAPPLTCGWLAFIHEPGTSDARAAIVSALVCIWAVRLTVNWIRTWGGPGHEDWRYVEIQKKTGKLYWLASLVAIHLFPAFLVWVGSLSLIPAIATGTNELGALDLLGVVVTGGAIAIEATADEQLRRYRMRASTPGAVMEEGLWAYSRHPNYFGEISFWLGLFVFAMAAQGPAAWTCVLGPLAMLALFVFGTIPMMEKRSLERRPAYAEVQKRVSMLVPWPRRKP
jgi:steroid 5-alpha reductase family enzyme